MVVKASQERVTTLLKDTITLLCRNGLDFKHKFTVDALIGVTLDDNDVFLISMKELVSLDNKTQAEPAEESAAENSEDGADIVHHTSARKRRKRKHREQEKPEASVRVKTEPDPDPGESFIESKSFLGNQDDQNSGSFVTRLEGGEPPNKEMRQEDMEPEDENDAEEDIDDDDDDDLVFVKQEASETQQSACSYQDSPSFSQNSLSFSPQNKNFSLADVSLDPSGSQNSLAWQQGMAQYSSPRHRQGTATMTTGQPDQIDPSLSLGQYQAQSPGQSQQMSPVEISPENNEGEKAASDTGDLSDTGDNFETSENKADESSLQNKSRSSNRECSFCHKTYSSAQSLRNHENVHRNIYPYYCPTCNKGFTGTTHLRAHMAEHTGVRGYQCPLCEKTFTYKQKLHRHIQFVHKRSPEQIDESILAPCYGESLDTVMKVRQIKKKKPKQSPVKKKPAADSDNFCCSFCGKNFMTSAGLKIHENQHGGIYPYYCELCQRGFVGSTHYKGHMAKHTGIREHLCTVCGKTFSYKQKLNRHLINVHKINKETSN